jgi:hypothetical protein
MTLRVVLYRLIEEYVRPEAASVLSRRLRNAIMPARWSRRLRIAPRSGMV